MPVTDSKYYYEAQNTTNANAFNIFGVGDILVIAKSKNCQNHVRSPQLLHHSTVFKTSWSGLLDLFTPAQMQCQCMLLGSCFIFDSAAVYTTSLQLTNTNSKICFLSVLSPKVIGIAIARYDFCARDMRELSLMKGDVVKIYTKMSANGWWRGEVNGRVRCSFFVVALSFLPLSHFCPHWQGFCKKIMEGVPTSETCFVYLNSQDTTCSHLCFTGVRQNSCQAAFPTSKLTG